MSALVSGAFASKYVTHATSSRSPTFVAAIPATESLAPTSDQLDAVELIAAPRTFVIERVSKGSDEQPVQVHLVGFPRVWRPSKGMRRVLAAGWGVDASKWAGRSVTLFFDPNVSFGKDRTGGTRIAAMSHLDKPLSVDSDDDHASAVVAPSIVLKKGVACFASARGRARTKRRSQERSVIG